MGFPGSICKRGHATKYSEEWDAYYCEVCNEWAEGTCNDPTCEFCIARPAKPIKTVRPRGTMRAWLNWFLQWIKYLYFEYKPKPKVKPVKPPRPPSPPKPGPRVPREYRIPREHTLEVLRLFDDFRNTKGSASVERHLMWKKIQEVLPQLPTGTWQIDAESATNVIIREVLDEKK